ncbi:ATP-binding protein [Streptomyces antibioticus]|uniref:ATP-binding protein n=1 Tax=Streptomyces antibioticus TaxID=1890 RepID=UPI003D72B0CD
MASVIPSAPLGTDAAAGHPRGLGTAAGARPSEAAAERRFRFELAAHPGSPAQARRLARTRLTGWAVCEDTCDTAALVISELVTNAIVHTDSDVVVCELYDGDDLVRISVRDEGCAPGEPHPTPQRPEEEHGRGLLLVAAVCHAWGAQEHGAGLLVWADVPRSAGPAHADGLDTDEPRDDLGWGAPPAPGPGDDTEHDDHTDHSGEGGEASTAPDPRVLRQNGGHPHRTAQAGTHPAHPAHRTPEPGTRPAHRAAPEPGAHPTHRAPEPAPHPAHPTHRATPDQATHPVRPLPHGPLSSVPKPPDQSSAGPAPRVTPQWQRTPGLDVRAAGTVPGDRGRERGRP